MPNPATSAPPAWVTPISASWLYLALTVPNSDRRLRAREADITSVRSLCILWVGPELRKHAWQQSKMQIPSKPPYTSRRAFSAAASVPSSRYSSSPPTGTPWARRVTATPAPLRRLRSPTLYEPASPRGAGLFLLASPGCLLGGATRTASPGWANPMRVAKYALVMARFALTGRQHDHAAIRAISAARRRSPSARQAR